MPTILQACGVSTDVELKGRNLLEPSTDAELNARPIAVFSESARMLSLYRNSWEMVFAQGTPVGPRR